MTVHLGASSFSLCCIDECVPDTVVAETQRRYHCSVVLQSQKGKTRTQSGQLSNMSHVLSPLRAGGGRERERAGREASISVLCLCKEWQEGVRRAEKSGNVRTI